jgi:hypothetical protein
MTKMSFAQDVDMIDAFPADRIDYGSYWPAFIPDRRTSHMIQISAAPAPACY